VRPTYSARWTIRAPIEPESINATIEARPSFTMGLI